MTRRVAYDGRRDATIDRRSEELKRVRRGEVEVEEEEEGEKRERERERKEGERRKEGDDRSQGRQALRVETLSF